MSSTRTPNKQDPRLGAIVRAALDAGSTTTQAISLLKLLNAAARGEQDLNEFALQVIDLVEVAVDKLEMVDCLLIDLVDKVEAR
jgi:hypothetical protein